MTVVLADNCRSLTCDSARFRGNAGAQPWGSRNSRVTPVRRASLFPVIVTGLLFIAASPAPSFAEDIACTMFTDAARTSNAAGPVAVDSTTTQQSVSVACDTRTIETKLVSTQSASALPQDWQNDSEKKLSAVYCSDPASRDIIGSGWTIEETTAFADGASRTIKASCQ